MKRILVLILGIIICLSGCTMIPKYNRPPAPIPGNWPSGAAYSQAQSTAKALDVTQLKWREFFTDLKLQQIIEIAINNNRNLKLAVFNVDRARALYGIERAKLLPVVNAEGALSKQRSSSDFLTPGASNVSKQYSVDLGITAWEVDFFGRIRSLKKQALEEYLATEEARRSAQIALVSEVARVYLIIAADRANLSLARSTLKAQEDAYNLVFRKHKLKLVNVIDLYRAQTQVDTAQGDVVLYTQQLAQDQNALNFLAGSAVPEDLLPLDLASVNPLMNIFPGLSSEVLLRRPDILDAEHLLKGAYANIGAARAAFFPVISLTTTLGSASNEFSGLFKSGKNTWAYAPQVVMPIFDPHTWFAYRVSETDQKIALTKYEKTIQTAFREVADVLAVQGTVDQQIAAQQSMVDSAQEVYRLSSKRYTNGIDSYLSVLDAQRSLYNAQQGLISMQLSKLANEVKAYAVFGGGGLVEADGKKQNDRDSFQEKILSLLDFELKKPAK
ncbi:MAG: efflux transporter outer membrane subunit [Candidatus Omnitrophica bacterium]|nr:efflux transporter outer membrane subunit [Candidatus Omnitrophota bacterium]MDD5252924.1 efflux transporter outer membrane subunit [Candidatus Omnitrophota bacterium]